MRVVNIEGKQMYALRMASRKEGVQNLQSMYMHDLQWSEQIIQPCHFVGVHSGLSAGL